jgi:WD40 repeat protein/serine/threonine protein kinase/tetratricopeptide (TPR) repeat protein
MEPSKSGAYDLLDQLVEEFAERYRRGQRPSVQEYIDKYPHLADDLREVLPAMVEIGQVEDDQRKAIVSPPTAAALPLKAVGDYRIIREIGRGGMGVVYEAEQQSLGRRVALKVLSAQVIGDGKALERFRREARSAARLHHTNIVPVFDVGQEGDVCYYAMQFIQGQSLDQVVDELRRLRAGSASRGRQPPEDPGSQVSQVAHSLLTGRFEPQQLAVSPPTSSQPAGAARPGDLTADDVPSAPGDAPPSGAATASTTSAVLPGQVELSRVEGDHRHYFRSVARVGQQTATALVYAHARGIVHRDIKPSNLLLDGSGVVWVTDFGLAKTEDEGLTNTGELPGTLRYMSPERFQGQCDVRTDVYALGLTLYEMLVLKPAFEASDRYRLIEQILQQQPARPRSVDAQIPRDLETIVLKAIDKEPRRRYQTAVELGEDLRRYLADEPIRARRVTSAERLARWCQRNPAVAGLVAAVALSLLLGTCVAMFFAIRANDNATRARTNEERANQNAEAAQSNEGKALKARDEADAARRETQDNLYRAEMNLAGQAAELPGGIGRVDELLDHWRPIGLEPDRRGWEWYYLRGLVQRSLLTLRRHTGAVQAVSWSPDGRRLASAGVDRTIKIWDAATARELTTLRGHTDLVTSLAWSPDGRRLASGGLRDLSVRLWDADTGQEIATLRGHGANVVALSWAPDSRRLVSVDNGESVVVWNAETGRQTEAFRGPHWLLTGAWSPDGRSIAVARDGSTILVWDVETKRQKTLSTGHNDWIKALTWSPDSRLLASGGNDESIRLWDTRQEREIGVLHGGGSEALAWSHDGRCLASASGDQIVRVWDVGTQKVAATLAGHTSGVMGVTWSPDDRFLASAGLDKTVRVWDVGTNHDKSTLRGHTGRVTAVSWSPDSRHLASGSTDRTIRLWDADAAQEIRLLSGHTHHVTALTWDPEGRRLATGGYDGSVRLWDADTGQGITIKPVTADQITHVSWSADGRRLAYWGFGVGGVEVWDTESNKVVRTLPTNGESVYALSWSPDGRILASGIGNTVRLWDASQGDEPTALRGHTETVLTVSWSPDGHRLASAGHDQTIKLWNVRTGEELATLRGHSNAVSGLSWSPDGRRLASSGSDSTVKLWDTETGREVLTLRGHTGPVTGVSWSRDGRRLASAGADQTIRIWDVTPGYASERSPLLLPELDRRLGADARSIPDLSLRAEILSCQGRWEQAADDWSHAANLQGDKAPPWFQAGWWVAGPTPPDTPVAEETASEIDPVHPGDAASLHWRAATTTADGCLDLAAVWPQAKPGSAFALLRVYSPREQPIAALVGSTGSLHLWHNGRLLYEVERGRLPEGEDEGVSLTLRAGWNTLLFKVGIGTAADRLCLWLSAEPSDRVRALARLGRWDEAEALLISLLKQQPQQPQALLLAGRFFRQRCEARRQQNQKAKADPDERQARAYYEKLATLQPDHAGYAAELADFLLPRSDHWEILEPVEMVSAGGTTLSKQPDGSILASGKNPWPETYTITLQTALTGIRAVRLELLTDPSLPVQGPGRSASGNIQLNEFRLTSAPVDDPVQARPVVLHNAWADYSDPSGPVAFAIDGKQDTPWSVWPEIGQPHVALFEIKEAISNANGTILTCLLEQGPGASEHSIGRFRLSVTARPQAVQEEKLRASLAKQNGSAWTKLAEAHYLRGEWQAGLAALKKATAVPSGGNGWDQLLLTLVHEQLGEHYEPTSAEAWIGRAEAYVELGEPDKAVADLAKALELQPEDLTVRQAHMELCLRLKKWDVALADCIKAVELKPDDPALLKLRADLYACCGKWAPAADDFAKLTDMDPSIYPRPWLPWYRHALALLAAGKTEEYRKACARMLDHFKDTEDAETAFFTAWTCSLGPDALPDFAPALHLAEKALAQGDQTARAHQAVGAIHYRAAHWEECVKHFHAAETAAKPQELTSSAYWHYFLAMAEHRLGHKEEARQWLDKAVAQTEKELRDESQTGGPDHWMRKATLQVLRAEAEALLRGGAAGPAK